MDDSQVRAALLCAFDAEDLADLGRVVLVVLDRVHQREKARLDAGEHGGREGGALRGQRWLGAEGAGEDVALPTRPLLGGVAHGAGKGEQRGVVGGVRRLLGDVGGGEAEQGDVGADVVAELDEVRRFAGFVGGEEVLLGHILKG